MNWDHPRSLDFVLQDDVESNLFMVSLKYHVLYRVIQKEWVTLMFS